MMTRERLTPNSPKYFPNLPNMTKRTIDNSISWRTVRFSNCLDELGIKKPHKTLARDYAKSGTIPVVDQGKNFITGWTNDESAAIRERLPFIIFGDHTRIFK